MSRLVRVPLIVALLTVFVSIWFPLVVARTASPAESHSPVFAQRQVPGTPGISGVAASPAPSSAATTGASQSGREIVVALDGSGDYTTITQAIDAAVDGDTVLVRPGTYREVLSVEKAITIRGDGEASEVVIDPEAPVPCERRVPVPCLVQLKDSHAVLADLTIAGPWSPQAPQVSVLVLGGAPTLERLEVWWGPILVTGGSRATVRGTAIGGGEIRVSGEGTAPLIEGNRAWRIRLDPGSSATVRTNLVEGIRVRGTGIVQGNVVRGTSGDWHGTRGVGIDVDDPGAGLVISQNFVHGHRIGVDVTRGASSAITFNGIGPNRTGLRVTRLGRLDLTGNEYCENIVHVWVQRGPRPDDFLVHCDSAG